MRNVIGRTVRYGMAVGIALGLRAGWMSAQDEAPLPASPNPPPEVQEREKLAKPPAPPGQSPQADQLLQKLHLSRAEIEQRKADKAQQELPASGDEPPDVKERKKMKAPEPPGRSPDVQELIEKVRKQPGGAEKLERAKKAKTGGPALQSSAERMPGPRMDGPIIGYPEVEQQPIGLRVTKAAPDHVVPGLGSMWGMDYMPWTSGSQGQWGPLNRDANPNYAIVGGPIDIKPFLQAGIYLANPGYYLINFVAVKDKASLRKWDPVSRTYLDVAQWDNAESPNWYESYPYVAKLAAGYHYFYWLPEPSTVSNIYVTEVSVSKL